jgi:hypothetical protein
MRSMETPQVEVVQSQGGYAMAEDGEEFIVYATSRPDQILGRFPGHDEGFTQAEKLYNTLLAPHRRRKYVMAFLILFFTALVVHVLSIVIVYVLQATASSSFAFGESESTRIVLIERWASTAAAIANAVWIAGLGGMAGIWLIQRVFPKSGATP